MGRGWGAVRSDKEITLTAHIEKIRHRAGRGASPFFFFATVVKAHWFSSRQPDHMTCERGKHDVAMRSAFTHASTGCISPPVTGVDGGRRKTIIPALAVRVRRHVVHVAQTFRISCGPVIVVTE